METVGNSSLKINWKDWQCLHHQYTSITQLHIMVPHSLICLMSSSFPPPRQMVRAQTMLHVASCLLLTFQDNFHPHQGFTALWPASIWKHHFNDLYSHCDKGRFFVKPHSWFSMLRLNSHEAEKGTSSVSTTSDRHTVFVHLSWHVLLERGQRYPVFVRSTTYLLFCYWQGPLWSLSTHLCNWSGIYKKHRPTHAHGARMQDTPWTIR